jgi:hypothetical protein
MLIEDSGDVAEQHVGAGGDVLGFLEAALLIPKQVFFKLGLVFCGQFSAPLNDAANRW